jgi:alkylated DNA repair dioxygenase AlkB
MMRDLFSVDKQFEPLHMQDANVSILHGLEMSASYEAVLRMLIDNVEWKQESVRIYGKVMPQPRLIAWYGDAGKKYDYSGISLTPLPWTELLREIKNRVEDCTGEQFNSVFLNHYRDHNDSMGFHSDDERELGPEPTIASVTFGATRAFVMKHKKDSDLAPVKVLLEAGSVLLMKGVTQRFWKHGILKQTRPCGPRVNLTFRTIFDR